MSMTIVAALAVVFALMIFGLMNATSAYSSDSADFEEFGTRSNLDEDNSLDHEIATKLVFQDNSNKLNIYAADDPVLSWLVENNFGKIMDDSKLRISEQRGNG